MAALVYEARDPGSPSVGAGELSALALLHEIFHSVVERYEESIRPEAMRDGVADLRTGLGRTAQRGLDRSGPQPGRVGADDCLAAPSCAAQHAHHQTDPEPAPGHPAHRLIVTRPHPSCPAPPHAPMPNRHGPGAIRSALRSAPKALSSLMPRAQLSRLALP